MDGFCFHQTGDPPRCWDSLLEFSPTNLRSPQLIGRQSLKKQGSPNKFGQLRGHLLACLYLKPLLALQILLQGCPFLEGKKTFHSNTPFLFHGNLSLLICSQDTCRTQEDSSRRRMSTVSSTGLVTGTAGATWDWFWGNALVEIFWEVENSPQEAISKEGKSKRSHPTNLPGAHLSFSSAFPPQGEHRNVHIHQFAQSLKWSSAWEHEDCL